MSTEFEHLVLGVAVHEHGGRLAATDQRGGLRAEIRPNEDQAVRPSIGHGSRDLERMVVLVDGHRGEHEADVEPATPLIDPGQDGTVEDVGVGACVG